MVFFISSLIHIALKEIVCYLVNMSLISHLLFINSLGYELNICVNWYLQSLDTNRLLDNEI